MAVGSLLDQQQNPASQLDRTKDDIHLIPHHGTLVTKRDLDHLLAMLTETSETVQNVRAAGKSLDEIPHAGLSARWSDRSAFVTIEERWTKTIFANLKEQE